MEMKKIISMLTAVACTGVMCASVHASAESMLELTETELTSALYDPCDVNHDGTVDILDVNAINKYIWGKLYVPDYERFDADRNLVVDYSDSLYIMKKIVKLSPQSVYISRKPTETEMSYPSSISSSVTRDMYTSYTTSRTYKKHIFGTDVSSYTTYTLTPSSTPMTTQAQEDINELIGDDDRYDASDLPETSGIIKITHEKGSGTGFIVGDHVIATAAHCIYAEGTFNKNLVLRILNADGTYTFLTPIEAHIPYDYHDAPEYDYGLITVAEDLSAYPHFNIGVHYNVDKTEFSNIPIYVTGYVGNTPYTAQGVIHSSPNSSYAFHYTTDTEKGESGSPVYIITKTVTSDNKVYNTYTALSINAYAGGVLNFGERMTKYHLQFYYGNNNIHYGEDTETS